MRSTQYIGLTQAARDFTKTLTKVEQTYNKTYGMFDEDIPLGVWTDGTFTYEEREQCSPWSSGPMIFTKLVQIIDGKQTTLYEWQESETPLPHHQELDYKLGIYYI